VGQRCSRRGGPSGLTRYTVSLREPWRTLTEALASLVSTHAQLGSILKRKAGTLLLCHHTGRRGKRLWRALSAHGCHSARDFIIPSFPSVRNCGNGMASLSTAAKVLTAGNGSEDLITGSMLTNERPFVRGGPRAGS
jgi:hypothetical protein